ncbi:MAG: YbaY family lipoprotein [Comamonas sp.]
MQRFPVSTLQPPPRHSWQLAPLTNARQAYIPPNMVEGTVTWRERIALPPDAVLAIQLQDTSRADASAQVVSQQTIRLLSLQPPFNIRPPVTANRLNPSARYTVCARVTSNAGNRLLFINDTAHPVLTRGAGNRADMVLVGTSP